MPVAEAYQHVIRFCENNKAEITVLAKKEASYVRAVISQGYVNIKTVPMSGKSWVIFQFDFQKAKVISYAPILFLFILPIILSLIFRSSTGLTTYGLSFAVLYLVWKAKKRSRIKNDAII